MPAYLVYNTTEPGAAPMSFDTLRAAVTWCEQNATFQRSRVVEVPNAPGQLPVVNPAVMRAVFST